MVCVPIARCPTSHFIRFLHIQSDSYTDGGVIPYPTLEEKKEIVLNAVETLHVLGYENPKITRLLPSGKK